MGEYFKKQTGESFQQYINSYRMKLIEFRLLYTSFRLNEIADEFGLLPTSCITFSIAQPSPALLPLM